MFDSTIPTPRPNLKVYGTLMSDPSAGGELPPGVQIMEFDDFRTLSNELVAAVRPLVSAHRILIEVVSFSKRGWKVVQKYQIDANPDEYLAPFTLEQVRLQKVTLVKDGDEIIQDSDHDPNSMWIVHPLEPVYGVTHIMEFSPDVEIALHPDHKSPN